MSVDDELAVMAKEIKRLKADLASSQRTLDRVEKQLEASREQVEELQYSEQYGLPAYQRSQYLERIFDLIPETEQCVTRQLEVAGDIELRNYLVAQISKYAGGGKWD
jgi:septal ring factor EnvC (AmiA/AmiB activator)